MANLFVYSTLTPDEGVDHEWLLIAPFVLSATPATVEGATLCQCSSFPVPGLRLGGNGSVDGWLLEVADGWQAAVAHTFAADVNLFDLAPVTVNLYGFDWPCVAVTHTINAQGWSPTGGDRWLAPVV